MGLLAVFACTIFATLLSSVRPGITAAATSSTINFQARLETNTGAVAPDGTYNVSFHLFSASSATGGTSTDTGCGTDTSCEWTEQYTYNSGAGSTDTRIRVVNGYLTVNLGSLTAFSGINWNQQQWLTMDIGGTVGSGTITWDGQMSPRLLLTATPYAFQAGGLSVTSGSNTDSLVMATPASASHTITVPDETGTICTTAGSAVCTSVYAAASGSGSYIQNGTTTQAANFNIQGSSSTAAAAVIQANNGGTGDILDLKNGTGGVVASLGNTGSALFGATTNSTIAFQVQNAGGANLFTVDTSNTAIVLGNDGTPGAFDVRGGAATGTNVPGGNLTFDASNGTGSGGSGDLIFRTGAGSSGWAVVSGENVSGTQSSSSTTFTLTLPAGTSLNDRLVLVTQLNASGVSAGSASMSVSDNKGNTWSKYAESPHWQPSGFDSVSEVWSAPQTTAGTTTVTMTYTGPAASSLQWAAAVQDYSGTSTATGSGAVDVSAVAKGSSTSPNSGTTGATTAAHELVIGGYSDDGANNTLNAGTGFTLRIKKDGTTVSQAAIEDEDSGSTGNTLSATLSPSSLTDWGMSAVVFKNTSSTASDALTDRLHITATGNVGINNASPQYTLDVSGTARVASSANSTTAFQVQNTSSSTILDVDTTNGYVGIGTNTPSAKLNISDVAFSDNFNRANNTSLGSNWTKVTDAGTDFQIVSNQLKETSSDNSTSALGAYTTQGITSANYAVQSDIIFPSSSDDWLSVMGRASLNGSSDTNGYYLFASMGSQRITLFKRVGTTWTQLGSSASETITAGTAYTMKLVMNGTNLYGYWSGTLAVSATDSTYSSAGFAGVAVGFPNLVNSIWDNFSITSVNPSLNVNNNFAVTANGWVGIGTTAPSYGIDLQSGSSINVTGNYLLNGTDINATGTLSNVAYLNQANTFTSSNLFKDSSNSTSAFRVQNAGGSSIFTVDTLNTMITLGSASSTPTLLVVGTKNTSGDPTCTNGAIYYNSTSGNNEFRACRNGTWYNLIAGVDVQTFTSNGTWTAPAGISTVLVIACGGGGSGGGGATLPSSTTVGVGGSAGGGGARVEEMMTAADAGSSQTITVGTQVSGGAAGAAGTQGNPSSFGNLIKAYGGGGGAAGAASSTLTSGGAGGGVGAAGGNGISGGSTLGGDNTAAATAGLGFAGGGGTSGTAGASSEYGGAAGGGGTTTTGTAGGSSVFGGAGGGAGGGSPGTSTNEAGSAGGSQGTVTSGSGASGGAAGTNAGTAGAVGSSIRCGAGGGGGGAQDASSGNGGNGGAGGAPGGGGGGGGDGVSSGSGGTGGAGATGKVWVFSW